MSHSSDLTIQNLKKILAINAQLNSTLEIGALLEIIMKTAAEVMKTHVASLLRVDVDAGELVFQVALGDKGGELKDKFRVKIGEGIAGAVAQTGQSLIVNDVSNDARFAKRFDDSTGFITKAILCVPMHAKNKVIGVLQAINPVNGLPFSADDQFLFETFADQAAIALENARMHGEVLKQERTKQDLKIAYEIQQNYLPDLSRNQFCVEIAAKNIPALEVGGDFYDVVELDKHRVGVVIGDVSGKGIPAALYMVRAISEFRFLSHRLVNPSQLLHELNRVLSENSPFGMFVTLVYMVIDTETRVMNYASGGHHAVLRRETKSGKVEALENIGGPPVGLVEGSIYNQQEIKIEAGDAFFAYTDGVVEARNKNKEEYGIKRLEFCLKEKKASALDYADLILSDLKKFTGNTDPHDDITVIGMIVAS